MGRISGGLCGLALAMMLAACGSGTPDTGNAATAKAENPREAKFKAIGKANKAIKDELEKPAPSLELIRENAARLGELAPQVPSWFPAGSGAESGIKTEALPAIWQQPDAFRLAAMNFANAAHGLQTAAAGTDIVQIQAASKELGATCKGCHDKFRQKK